MRKMNKVVSAFLSAAMLVTGGISAMAAEMPAAEAWTIYTNENGNTQDQINGRTGNPATFESLAEACARGIEEGIGTYSDLVADYPEGTTWIYRSSDRYGMHTYWRMNTNFIYFCSEKFETKEEAWAHLETTGMIDLVEEKKGAVIMITPQEDTWSVADFDIYRKLQQMMVYYQQNNFGTLDYAYVVAEGDAATFVNNYFATRSSAMPYGNRSYIGTIAGMLLVGGEMAEDRALGYEVPVFLAGATDTAVSVYTAGNNVAEEAETKGGLTVYTNPKYEQDEVIVTTDTSKTLKEYVEMAYNELFKHWGRTPYQVWTDYFFGSSPYQLYPMTEYGVDGVEYEAHENGEALEGTNIIRWYEYYPSDLETKEEDSIPLVLVLHGADDEPRAIVTDTGWLKLAEKEDVIMVSPDHQSIGADGSDKVAQLDMLVQYMIDKYPQIDESRIYCTGYSMGGGMTCQMGFEDTARFAAIAPMGNNPSKYLEAGLASELKLPMQIQQSDHDCLGAQIDGNSGRIGGMFGSTLPAVNAARAINGLELLDMEAPDFEEYGAVGVPFDTLEAHSSQLLNYNLGKYFDEDGVPVVEYVVLQGTEHVLHTGYAEITWEFLKNFSRDQETMEIVYTPAE